MRWENNMRAASTADKAAVEAQREIAYQLKRIANQMEEPQQ